MTEKKDIAYRIYQAETKVSVFDLLYEFGIAYTALKPILDEFVKNKILATEDGKYYEFIGDGRMFSGKYKKEQLQGFSNEQEKELQERQAYLEARRRELIKKMQADLEAADEENEAERDDDEEASLDEAALFELRMAQKIMMGGSCIEDEEEDEDNDSKPDDDLGKLVLKNLIGSIAVNEHDDHYFIEINGIELCGTGVKFEFLSCDGKVYLCDQGATFCSLEETVELNDEVRDQAKRIAEENGAEFMDEKFCIEVASAEQTLACLFRLYAAMERVYHIGDALPRKEKKAEVPEKYIKTLEYIVRSRKASIIDLHAKFGFAFHEIGFMLDWMEKEGFITPFYKETKKREVLLTLDEFKRRFGRK